MGFFSIFQTRKYLKIRVYKDCYKLPCRQKGPPHLWHALKRGSELFICGAHMKYLCRHQEPHFKWHNLKTDVIISTTQPHRMNNYFTTHTHTHQSVNILKLKKETANTLVFFFPVMHRHSSPWSLWTINPQIWSRHHPSRVRQLWKSPI